MNHTIKLIEQTEPDGQKYFAPHVLDEASQRMMEHLIGELCADLRKLLRLEFLAELHGWQVEVIR